MPDIGANQHVDEMQLMRIPSGAIRISSGTAERLSNKNRPSAVMGRRDR